VAATVVMHAWYMQPAEQGLPDGLGGRPDQAKALAVVRARSADQRDRLADQRDRRADAREAVADRRDQMADAREARLDAREARLDGQAWGAGLLTPDRHKWVQEVLGRSTERAARSVAALGRDEAAGQRDEAARSRRARREARAQAAL